jgi:hypothetical protein
VKSGRGWKEYWVGVCFLGLVLLGSLSARRDEVSVTSKSRVIPANPIPISWTGRQAVSIVVKSSAVPGPKAGFYTYTYTVTSDHRSTRGVSDFGISPVSAPDSMAGPWQWMAGYGYQEDGSAAVWACADTITEPPAGIEDAGSYSSPYEIQPGETKVFTLVSRHPPGDCSFYAQGFDSLPDVGTYFEEEFPGEVNTAGSPEYPSLFRVGVTGRAIGPEIEEQSGSSSLSEGKARGGPTVRTIGGLHTIDLPTDMKKALRDHDPRFKIWEQEAYDQEIIGWYSYSDRESPSAIVGDFNGDGVRDVALYGRNETDTAIYCLLSGPHGFRVVEVEKREGIAHERLTLYLSVVPRGRAGLMEGELHLKTEAIRVSSWEKSSSIYFFEGGRFKVVQEMD